MWDPRYLTKDRTPRPLLGADADVTVFDHRDLGHLDKKMKVGVGSRSSGIR